MIVTLDEAKLHLRVDGSDEDALIQLYIDAASSAAASYLNRDVPDAADPAIKAAVLLSIGGLYDQREDIVIGSSLDLNPTVRNLLNPHRVAMGV